MSTALANPSGMRGTHWSGVFLGIALVMPVCFTFFHESIPVKIENFVIMGIPILCLVIHAVCGFLCPVLYEPRVYSLFRGLLAAFFFFSVNFEIGDTLLFLFGLFFMSFAVVCLMANNRTRRLGVCRKLVTVLIIDYMLIFLVWLFNFIAMISVGLRQYSFFRQLSVLGNEDVCYGLIHACFFVLLPLAGILEIVKAVVYGRGAGCAGGNRDGNHSDPAAE